MDSNRLAKPWSPSAVRGRRSEQTDGSPVIAGTSNLVWLQAVVWTSCVFTLDGSRANYPLSNDRLLDVLSCNNKLDVPSWSTRFPLRVNF